jgi:Putative beta barrel porin-7 (BBP7)
MRSGLSLVLGACLFAAAPGFAQSQPPPVIPGPLTLPDGKGPPSITEVPIAPLVQPVIQDSFRFWVRAEYLAWWVKSAPQPISVLTGDPNNPTQELLNSDGGFGLTSGFRIGLGMWFDSANTVGLETTFFTLERRTRSFGASSDDGGNPTLVLPFVNQTPGAIGASQLTITSPGLFAGNVLVESTMQLWGMEANGALVLIPRSSGFELTALAGFRYVDLLEHLNITTLSSDITTNPNTILLQSDQFGTRNQFFGGQLGGKVSWQGDRIGLDLAGKLALGATHQTVDIQGFSTQAGPNVVNGTFPGGFFTQQSNMGRYTANRFSVIPSLEMKFYMYLTQQLRAFVGYDFMYWSQVVRPGNQIDRNVNLSQSSIYGNGALMGQAFPAAQFSRSDFWAQGVTFGLEFKF